jgi:type II secretion system (T2SS) protein E
LGDDARSASADTNSSTTYRPASSGSGGGVTPELVLVDPELAQAQRQTRNRKAAMSSTEPANTFPEPAQHAPTTPPPAEPSMRDVPLGTLIFRAGLLGEEQLEDALQEGMRTGKRLGEVLLERGWLNERDLGQMLAGQKGLPFVDVALSDVEADALEALDQDDARRQVALPLFYEDGELVIAVGDPSNEVVLEGLRRVIKTEFQLVVAPHGQLLQVIDEAYARPDPEPAPPFEGVLFPNLRPRMQDEASAEPEPRPDSGFAPAVEPEPAPEPQDEAAPEVATPAEPDDAAEAEERPSSGPTPTLLSRMLFPSVRQAAQDADAAVDEQEEPPAAEQPEEEVEQPEGPAPAAVEDLAELEVPAPPEMPVSSFEEQVAEPQPAEAAEAAEPVAEAQEAAPDEPAEPAPTLVPAAEQPADDAQPTTHVVLVRLRDGEPVRIGEHPNAAAASAQAAKTVGQISSAAAGGKWPFFDGRYLSPDTIVSVDLLEESPDA